MSVFSFVRVSKLLVSGEVLRNVCFPMSVAFAFDFGFGYVTLIVEVGLKKN